MSLSQMPTIRNLLPTNGTNTGSGTFTEDSTQAKKA